MAGTTLGGQKAAATNKARHGDNFYHPLGAIGGRISRNGGFTDRELARKAGAVGGRISSKSKDAPPLESRRLKEAHRGFQEGF